MSVSINGTTGLTFADATTQTTSAFYGGLAMRNRIINGAMVIDQRNAGAAVTLTSGGVYTVDRWQGFEDTDGTITAQQSTTAPTGFTNSLVCTTTVADASLAAAQFALIQQKVEGFNFSDFGWGTANAQPVAISFWVRSSLTGTFGGALADTAAAYSYPFTFTISAANTWEQKTVIVTGPTSGTFNTNNGIGLVIRFGLGVGSSFNGTAGAWAVGTYFSATGAVSVVGTSGATFYITGVQLEKGSTATAFDYRPYGTELAMCQRYYEVGLDRNALVWSGITLAVAGTYYTNKGFCVTKRAAPNVTFSGEVLSGFASGSPGATIDTTGIQISRTSNGTASTNGYYFYNWQASAEL